VEEKKSMKLKEALAAGYMNDKSLAWFRSKTVAGQIASTNTEIAASL